MSIVYKSHQEVADTSITNFPTEPQFLLKFSSRSSGRSPRSFAEHYADPIVSVGFGKNSWSGSETASPSSPHFSKNCKDVQLPESDTEAADTPSVHENARGAAYYQ